MAYVKSFKGFNKAESKTTKKLEEDAGSSMMQVPEEFKAEKDTLDKEQQSIAAAKLSLAQREADLTRKYADLQSRVATKQAQPAPQTPTA
jgi:FtsZ-binding cell division protein ZapB